ncbi:hypothetical protein AB0M91_17725 [Micromonospora rifamycinica]|uniref:hypothetical protein n=1 Tax=Micromonospora rifamycinica TaxID=291594 RepID=UPI003447533C
MGAPVVGRSAMSTDTIEATPVEQEAPEPTSPDTAGDDLPLSEADEPTDQPADDNPSGPAEDDGPVGFPGGALLISAADMAAVGGGAVWAGATGFGALLLAAAATAAAGLAMADRKAKRDRARRDGTGRTGQSARPSRRTTAAGSGGTAGGRGRHRPGGGKGTPGGGVFGRSKPGGKHGGTGKPTAGGPFSRSGKNKPSAGGGLFGRKPGKGSGGTGGGLFGRKPGGGNASPGGGGLSGRSGKNTGKGKGRKPHVISDPGFRPLTGTGSRGRNGRKSSPKPVGSADEAARRAEEARKAIDTATKPNADNPEVKPADGTDTAGTTTNGGGPAVLVGPQEFTAGGALMGQFPLPGAASEFRSAASRYTPDDMYEFGAHLAQMPAAMLDIAEGLKAMALRTHAERPVDPRVVEALAALYQVQRATIAAAETIAPVFRKVHERDLARKEAPRTNEQEWNV